ncbi:SpoIID/LytB domain-containing protein [Prevotella nigrescens]|uniref:SpoIID/LytB domain-containing protein n=1 Tax=Prevotella nigrescens TaxID=28133 RepID=UPI0002184087|nr:SpoIID/LytB domain-containing protein [Prevotella nigrescens]EGQ17132.1 amidase enhancer precursor [Prevotella nigrescens ATCC 33563]UAK27685.1 SpoIID/LytB domain-containing protein [Prevotella nigrescens]WMS21576.1 SpoIID/LytB domain-containing protein [Prevotella nigrescens]SUB92263.1 H-34 [Prevotella nigrescens]
METSNRKEEPIVSVGIVSASKLLFSLNAPYTVCGSQRFGKQVVELSEGRILWENTLYDELLFEPTDAQSSFTLEDVTIGVNFHWERKEAQTFLGKLRFIVEDNNICAINELPVETYLTSVISSEMRATSSLELLKAHAVISRSWLLAQIEQRKAENNNVEKQPSFFKTNEEIVRWYDREDHKQFDVCADDHCQRYQGITKAANKHVVEAIQQTAGEILTSHGEICDARYSKCCGGAVEEFQYCWENIKKPYLQALSDTLPDSTPLPDLTDEAVARQWILSSPDAFCNTTDQKVLSQVLNDFDQETTDFYRWSQTYSQAELKQLLEEKLEVQFGDIIDLVPLSRGKSGRIYRLKIVGKERTLIIGKELEIRRALSKSHLYSSAFIVEKADIKDGVPQKFIIKGAGWGHGVGLCQIGAAMMGKQGYPYEEILLHYYKGAEITKAY